MKVIKTTVAVFLQDVVWAMFYLHSSYSLKWLFYLIVINYFLVVLGSIRNFTFELSCCLATLTTWAGSFVALQQGALAVPQHLPRLSVISIPSLRAWHRL